MEDTSHFQISNVSSGLYAVVYCTYNTGDGNSEIRHSDKKTDSALLLFLQIFIITLVCLHITHEYIHLGFAVKLCIRHYTVCTLISNNNNPGPIKCLIFIFVKHLWYKLQNLKYTLYSTVRMLCRYCAF